MYFHAASGPCEDGEKLGPSGCEGNPLIVYILIIHFLNILNILSRFHQNYYNLMQRLMSVRKARIPVTRLVWESAATPRDPSRVPVHPDISYLSMESLASVNRFTSYAFL